MGIERVLIVGSGGREHALAWACGRDAPEVAIIVAPGNAGTAGIAENVAIDVTDAAEVARLASERAVDLVIIGPDAAAAACVADACHARGILVFGPTAAAARIESSKTFAKQVMAYRPRGGSRATPPIADASVPLSQSSAGRAWSRRTGWRWARA